MWEGVSGGAVDPRAGCGAGREQGPRGRGCEEVVLGAGLGPGGLRGLGGCQAQAHKIVGEGKAGKMSVLGFRWAGL